MKLFILVTAIPLALAFVLFALGSSRRKRRHKAADGDGTPLYLTQSDSSGARRGPDQPAEEGSGQAGGDGGGDGGGD